MCAYKTNIGLANCAPFNLNVSSLALLMKTLAGIFMTGTVTPSVIITVKGGTSGVSYIFKKAGNFFFG